MSKMSHLPIGNFDRASRTPPVRIRPTGNQGWREVSLEAKRWIHWLGCITHDRRRAPHWRGWSYCSCWCSARACTRRTWKIDHPIPLLDENQPRTKLINIHGEDAWRDIYSDTLGLIDLGWQWIFCALSFKPGMRVLFLHISPNYEATSLFATAQIFGKELH